MHTVISKFLSGTEQPQATILVLKISRRTSYELQYSCMYGYMSVWLGIIKLLLHETDFRAGSCNMETMISERCWC